MTIRVPSQVDIENTLQSLVKAHGINEPNDGSIVTWAMWKWIASFTAKQAEGMKPEFKATANKDLVFNRHGVVVTAQEKTRSGSVDMAKLCSAVCMHKGKMTVEIFNDLCDKARKKSTTYVETSVVIPGNLGGGR